MNELTQPSGLWAGIGTGIAGIIAGAFWLINKISNSSVDRAGDRAEINIIQVLQEDNAKLRELLAASEAAKLQYFQQSVESASQVTMLQEKVATLTDKIDLLNNEVVRLRDALEKRP